MKVSNNLTKEMERNLTGGSMDDYIDAIPFIASTIIEASTIKESE